MNLRSRAYLYRFAYLNRGVDREEFATSACALNSTLIGMCKRNVLGSMRTHFDTSEFICAYDSFWVLAYAKFQ